MRSAHSTPGELNRAGVGSEEELGCDFPVSTLTLNLTAFGSMFNGCFEGWTGDTGAEPVPFVPGSAAAAIKQTAHPRKRHSKKKHLVFIVFSTRTVK
jgi:hypothetical protein